MALDTPYYPSSLHEAIKPRGRPLRFHQRSGDQVLLLHLPCTSGSALFSLLASYFPAEAVCSLDAWPQTEADDAAAAGQIGEARLIRGYVDYEVYRYLPRTPIYMTMLRHPVDRVVALYQRIRTDAAHPYHTRLLDTSLIDFVCDPAYSRDVVNVQTRRLATSAWRDVSGLADQTLLEMAKVNLYEFAFFGIAERFADIPFLLAYSMDWPVPAQIPAAPPESLPEIPEAAYEAIRERNRLDEQLYEDACRVFDQRCRQMLHELTAQNYLWHSVYADRLAEYQYLQGTWSWQVLEKIKAVRRWLLPPNSRREQIYHRVGKRLFQQKPPDLE